MDETNNPFAAPDSRVEACHPSFAGLEKKALLTLNYKVRSIRAIAVFWLLFALIGFVTALELLPALSQAAFAFCLGLLFAVAAVGCFRATQWGFYLGMSLSVLMTAVFGLTLILGYTNFLPFIFGIVGLFSFFRAGKLFGPNRLDWKAVAAEAKRLQRRG